MPTNFSKSPEGHIAPLFPFAPMIMYAKMPMDLIRRMNKYVNKTIKDEEKIKRCAENKNIKIEGLMTMGPNTKSKKDIARAFKKTKELFDCLNTSDKLEMKTLSMGMSGDYEVAIEQGSTDIRVGSAIFGPRD